MSTSPTMAMFSSNVPFHIYCKLKYPGTVIYCWRLYFCGIPAMK